MPSKANGFDTSGLRELGRVFGEYRAYNQRSTGLLLHQLGEKLQVDLYLACGKLRASQRAKIEALPEQLNYKIKRRLTSDVGKLGNPLAQFKKGPRAGQFKSKSIASQERRANAGQEHVSVVSEIRLRKRFAAWFQATGWIANTISRLRNVRPMGNLPRAVVVEQLTGEQMRVTLTNPRPNSAEFAASTGYLDAAFQNRVNDMKTYIQRKINGDAGEFNRPHPNFAGKNVAESVERAMGGRLAA